MKTFIEHNNEVVLDEAVKYHVDKGIPLTQSVFRMYSENFLIYSTKLERCMRVVSINLNQKK